MNFISATQIRYVRLFGVYAFGQGLTQLLQLVSGFLLIRFLAKDDYAVLTLIMSIAATARILMELGIGQALTALIGSVYGDLGAMGRYIRACRFYRDRMLGVGIVVLFFVLLLISPVFGWKSDFLIITWACVAATLVSQAISAVYSPILLLDQNLKRVYTLGLVSGVFRLSCISIAYYFGFINAIWAIFFGMLQAMIEARAYYSMTLHRIEYPGKSADISREKKELLGQTLPRVPGYTFLAFEGQITIFILSALGTTSSLAELGALSRLGLLFVFFNRMGGVLVAPYMAKLKASDVLRRSGLIISSISVLVLLLLLLVYFFPQPLLLILGDGYQHLQYEVFLVVLASCIRMIDVFIFSICSARKYIFSWFSAIDVVPVLIVMIIGFSLLDLSQLTNVLYYGIGIATIRLLSKVFIIGVGLRREAINIRAKLN